MGEQPKYLMVADTLRRQIAEGLYHDGDRLMTEESLRERFNVSRQTVRQAIALLEDDGLVERKQGSGTYVSHGSRKHRDVIRIGVVTTYITDYIFPEIVSGIENVLRRNGVVMTLSATYNDPETERQILERMVGQVDGLIAEGVRTSSGAVNGEYFRTLAERNVPVLFMNSGYRNLGGIPSVVMDDREGGRQACRALLERGYTRPAGMFKTDDIQGQERMEGMLEVLQERGLTLPPERLFRFGTEHRMNFLANPEGAAFFEMLIAGGADCVVCYNDVFAAHLMRELMNRGVRIPEDLGIIGFDNSVYAGMTHPRLTTLNHPKEAFGELVAEKMLRMTEGAREKSEKVSWKLIEAESLPDRKRE